MGLRSVFIPIKNKADLTAVLLMNEALDDVAGYLCNYGIYYFCEYKGRVYCAYAHDGCTAFESYSAFSPSFDFYTYITEFPRDKAKTIKPKDLESYFSK